MKSSRTSSPNATRLVVFPAPKNTTDLSANRVTRSVTNPTTSSTSIRRVGSPQQIDTKPTKPDLNRRFSNRIIRSATNPTFSPATRPVNAQQQTATTPVHSHATAKTHRETDVEFLKRMSSPRAASAAARTQKTDIPSIQLLPNQSLVRTATNTTLTATSRSRFSSPINSPAASTRTFASSNTAKPTTSYGVTQYKTRAQRFFSATLEGQQAQHYEFKK